MDKSQLYTEHLDEMFGTALLDNLTEEDVVKLTQIVKKAHCGKSSSALSYYINFKFNITKFERSIDKQEIYGNIEVQINKLNTNRRGQI